MAFEHRVGADPTLPLQGEGFAVELAGEGHQAVELEEFLVAQARSVADQAALRIEDLQHVGVASVGMGARHDAPDRGDAGGYSTDTARPGAPMNR